MIKKLSDINYDKDMSIEGLEDIYQEIDDLYPKLKTVEEKDKAQDMMEEIDYFIGLKERDILL